VIETHATVLRAGGVPGDGTPPPFEALAVEPVLLREPGPGEVLVDVVAACICHSDLSVLTGHRPRPLPMALGHEASGRVAAVGAGVTRFAPGQPVLMTYVPRCGHCRACAEGRPALCEPGAAANTAGELLSGGRPFQDAGGSELHQHLGLSAFARQTVVAQESLLALPDDVPLAEAALLGCAVMTGFGAVANTARVEPGATVAVFGLGGVGLCSILGARLAGAGRVIGIDPDARTHALARELGADETLLSADAVEEVRELTGGGADYAFEAAGVAAAFEQAYAATRRGGTTVVVGLADPAARVAVSPSELVATERTVRGSYMGSTVPERDVPRYVELLRAGRLPLERLVGERLTLDDVPAGMRRLHEGVVGRQLVLIGEAA
jgi:alcohol dehydrogenase